MMRKFKVIFVNLTLLVSVVVEITHFSGSHLFNCAWLNNALKLSGYRESDDRKIFHIVWKEVDHPLRIRDRPTGSWTATFFEQNNY